jgi:hypothetical protein
MNEQIQQLAVEAGMYVDLNGQPWPKCMSAEECELAYAKFAELLVQTCATLLPSDMTHGPDGRPLSRVFEEYFGVE